MIDLSEHKRCVGIDYKNHAHLVDGSARSGERFYLVIEMSDEKSAREWVADWQSGRYSEDTLAS